MLHIFECKFSVFNWYFVGTYNVSGVHLVTTGRATGNIFMIYSVAMRCHWLCGVCSIESTVSWLWRINIASLGQIAPTPLKLSAA